MDKQEPAPAMRPLNVLMIGTGEYTTGFVAGAASASDKKVGVVGLTMFDLRRRGKVGWLGMAGVDGTKFPAIREHLDRNIRRVYNGLDTSFASFPGDGARDAEAYKAAIDALRPGDAVTVFTPDPTHMPIALYAVDRGLHVLLTKPAVQRLANHQALLARARARGRVLVLVEHHKRYDPAYADARARARRLGDFSYFYAYMAQPRFQLDTFRAWAGTASDVSYYLNSHHVDVCDSMVRPLGYRPVRVAAASAAGVATGRMRCAPGTEDAVTLTVTWARARAPSAVARAPSAETSGAGAETGGAGVDTSGAGVDTSGAGTETSGTDPSPEMETAERRAVGVFTACWTAPERSGVHTTQHFHYLASGGEVRVDQSRRGYDVVTDPDPDPSSVSGPGPGPGPVQWPNPFYMAYAPGDDGHFAGQAGYGYLSLERFVDGCRAVNAAAASPADLDARDGLPTLANTVATTAVLEAGRRSLDGGGRPVDVRVGADGVWTLV